MELARIAQVTAGLPLRRSSSSARLVHVADVATTGLVAGGEDLPVGGDSVGDGSAVQPVTRDVTTRPGDVLVVARGDFGESVRAAVVTPSAAGAIVTANLHRIRLHSTSMTAAQPREDPCERPDDNLDGLHEAQVEHTVLSRHIADLRAHLGSVYLVAVLNTESVRRQLQGARSEGATPALPLSAIKSLRIPYPDEYTRARVAELWIRMQLAHTAALATAASRRAYALAVIEAALEGLEASS